MQLLRPHQWTKNLFVWAGVVFGHAWGRPDMVASAAWAFAAFCALSSAGYIFNDWTDRERDARHPRKRLRPLASGRISGGAAASLATLLAAAAFGMAYLAGPGVLIALAAYAMLNVGYTCWLKHVVVLDVFCIAAGFMLRVLAGTYGIGIPASSWLLFCSGMLTLFLAFAKRRSEMAAQPILAAEEAPVTPSDTARPVLNHYTLALLDNFLAITSTCCVVAYGLYTMSPETIRLHGTSHLIFTLPFVLYGLFRYLYLLHAEQAGEDISRDFFADKHLWITVVAWLAATLWLIY